MGEPADILMRWLRAGETLAAIAALAVGALSAVAPGRSIAFYQWIMARCNWRVAPIDDARELRNTRLLGTILIGLSLALVWCASGRW